MANERFAQSQMRTVLLIVICATALIAGALVGQRNPVAAVRPPSEPGATLTTRSGDGEQRADGTLAFASDDARIVRVFSALQEPVLLKKRSELFDALRDLTAEDLPTLVKHADGLPTLRRSELLPVLVERWFELDSDAALNWMRARPNETDSSIIAAFARANPDAAMAEALATPGGYRSTMLLRGAIKQLAPEDPAAQAARLKTLPSGTLRDTALQHVIAKWAEKDPAAAFAALANLPPGRTRDSARGDVLRQWAERDPAAAIAQANTILPTLQAGVLGNDLITGMAERIGKNDPRLALDWLSGLPPEFRSDPAIAAARVWAAKEPVAALDWGLENGVDVARGKRTSLNSSEAGVLAEAIAAQPQAVAAWLEALPAGPGRDRLIERGLEDSLWRAPKDQLPPAITRSRCASSTSCRKMGKSAPRQSSARRERSKAT